MMAFCEPSKGIMCCSIVLPIIPREGGYGTKVIKKRTESKKIIIILELNPKML